MYIAQDEWLRVYLGCPYSTPVVECRDMAEVMDERFEKVTIVAGWLMSMGWLVMSPITHGHPIAGRVALPRTWEYWQRVCNWQMSGCDQMLVLQLDGWEESVGLGSEILIAEREGMHIVKMTYEEVESMYNHFNSHTNISGGGPVRPHPLPPVKGAIKCP